MKKSLLFIGLLCTCFFAKAQFSIGGGVGFGFDVEEIGIQARGVYEFNETWRGEADFMYYLEGQELINFWELNLNANYVFVDNGDSKVYALGGLNFFHVGVDVNVFGVNVGASATEFSVNLGGGGQLGLSDALDGFAELKLAVGGASQLVLAAGVLFDL